MMSPSIAPRGNPDGSPGSTGPTQITQIVTSKTWVLPPRPKPGRKPSSDVPTTKRKAQNRAAQRAFRERRANRVTELEKQLMELERDKSVKEGILSNTINGLQHENQALQKLVKSLKEKVSELSRHLDDSSSSASTPQPGSKRRRFSISESSSPENHSDLAEAASAMINFKNSRNSLSSPASRGSISRGSLSSHGSISGSGSIGSMLTMTTDSPSPKDSIYDLLESFKPMAAVPLKKETDFTEHSHQMNKPASRRMPTLDLGSTEDDELLDSEHKCGFCSDDSPCVCREIAKQKKAEEEEKERETQRQQQQQQQQQQQGFSQLTPAQEKQINEQVSQCTGDPGNCPQCQKDPMSTLFCTTLAAATSKVRSDTSAIRDSRALEDSRSDSQESLALSLPAPNLLVKQGGSKHLPSIVELELSNPGKHFVPCADAYRTLSRHANFRRAGFNKIINNLNTSGMFVEVESIVKCLRQLDRQFGSN